MGRPPQAIRAWLDRPVKALQLCRWKFSHKETLQQTFFERSTLLEGKMVNLRFWTSFEGLRGNVGKARWKARIVDFLLVIIELFFPVGAFVSWQFMHLTDGRADGFTNTALHSMQRGKNQRSRNLYSNNKWSNNNKLTYRYFTTISEPRYEII